MSPAKLLVLFFGLALLPLTPASAQLSGSRGAVGGGSDQTHESSGLAPLDPEVAQGYITIEGQAELRVKPTEIRVVLAVTAEGKTPSECKRKVSDTIKSLTAAWMEAGIAQESIVEDFIAVLPRYEFDIEKIRDQDESFTNSNDAEYETSYSRRDIPVVRTFRPKNTYYRGLYPDGDVQSKELPMQSEISIVSTVRLYFESPAAKERPTSKKVEQ